MSDELEEQLSAYVDGELSPADRARVEAALAQDQQLRALEQRLRRVPALAAALPEVEPSVALRRAVLAQVDERTWQERWTRWWRPGLLLSAGAAALVVLTLQVGSPVGSGLPVEAAPLLDADALALATHWDELDDMDVVGVAAADDLDVIANLNELEATP